MLKIFKKKKASKKIDKEKADVNVEEMVAEVIVFREQGENAKEIMHFNAIQVNEDGFNLTLINEDAKFKKEVNIVEDELISSLRNRLDLSGDDNSGQITKIKQRIEIQHQILAEIRDKNYKKVEELKEGVGELPDSEKENYEKKGIKRKYNTIDEEVKLRQLESLLYVVENDNKKGSYEFFNLKNKRKYFYTYIDGHVFPVKYNAVKKSMHVGITSKVKNYRSEQAIIDKKRDAKLNGFTNWAKIILNALLILLIVVNIFWSQQNYRDRVNQNTIIDEEVQVYRRTFYGEMISSDVKLVNECKNYCASYCGENDKKEPINQSLQLLKQVN